MKKILLTITFFSIFFTAVFSQNTTDEQLAIQYFQNEEYEKAIVIFEELFEKDQSSLYIYNYYFSCLLNLKEFKEAKSLLKKLNRKYPDKTEYIVDLGYLYELTDNDKKAKNIYKDVLNDLTADEVIIRHVANAFYKRKKIDLAIKTYQKGRKILRDKTAFGFTLATLYSLNGEIENMTFEYLQILDNTPKKLEAIQDLLQDKIQATATYKKVKTIVIKEVQSKNYPSTYVDLLSWLFIQKKDFKAAFRQQKALDKRYNNNNRGLIKLSETCILNKAYSVAEEIYNYIISKGQKTPYFYHAKFGLIDIQYLQLKNNPNPDIESIRKIEKEYSEYINYEFYKYIRLTEKVILRLGEIKAVYLNNVPGAINFLSKYLNVRQISKETKAQIKLSLGDYYVLDGDVWEATLLYKQVDKMFRDHPLGHIAKFRSAKLSFFMGDFEWANDQLDILKASTSELIANDALQLSMLIQDNLGLDSTDHALKMYARADFYLFKNNFNSATTTIDSIFLKFPQHSLSDDALFLKGRIQLKQKHFEKAIENFQNVYKNYPDDILADDALYKTAIIYEQFLNNNEEAFKIYEKIILDYPGSVFVVNARNKYRKMKTDKKDILIEN
ncbi:MAG: tetratricopeptide repeat protein [Bacteroidota bacterium]|nr:tetratricopeptide repeat protein [Bacteroidota bacterium]